MKKINRNDDRGQNFIRGSQIFFQNLRMFIEASNKILYWGLLLCVPVMILFLVLWLQPSSVYLFYKFYIAKASVGLETKALSQTFTVSYNGRTYTPYFSQFLTDPYVLGAVSDVWTALIDAVMIGFGVFIVTAVIATKCFQTSGQNLSADKFIRGAKFTSNEGYIEATKLIKVSPIKIPAIQNSQTIYKTMNYNRAHTKLLSLPRYFEIQHILIHGTVGAGKSQLTLNLLSQIINLPKKSKRIFIDVGCHIVPYLYNPQEDYILSAFDKRSVRWNLFDEFTTETDFANLATYLIPMPPNISDPFWINAPRSIVASAAYTMQDDKDRSVKKLLDHLLMSDISELCEYLSESEARRVVSEKTAKTTMSLLAVLASYVRCLKYLIGTENNDTEDFSIKKWIQDENASGTLFITIPEDKRQEMKGLVTLWLSQAIDSTLAMEESKDRRIYFVCDEIGVFNKLEKLQTGMGLGRKYGLSFILGMQSFNQFVGTYGENMAEELFDFMNTQFYFRSNRSKTAKFASENLGEEEVELSTLNRSYSGHQQDRQGVSMINQISTRPIAHYSEIQALRDLECYMRAQMGLPITKIHLNPFQGKKLYQGHIPREPVPYTAADDVLEKIDRNSLDPAIADYVQGVTVKKKKPKKSDTDGGESAVESAEVITEDGEILKASTPTASANEESDSESLVDEDSSDERLEKPKRKSSKKVSKKAGKKVDQANDLIIIEKSEYDPLDL